MGPVLWSIQWAGGPAALSVPEREPFYTGTQTPTAAYVGGLRLPMRFAEDGEVLFETEPERPGGRWILFEPLGNKQIGDTLN